ncbi:zinc-dependent alcohol dehydrogenase family protein [Parasphingorhabdus sp.]|uniref:zinc-dependent alcohol dehydrogenase family protein n=1 Tax=Parasphingorhabdus sp. TaxID=2709688 RepID=UPI003A8D267C
MKAYEIGPQSGLEGIRLVERDMPVPGRGEVAVKVHSACLNHRDMLTLKGQYGPLKAQDRIPLSDGVGSVVALGENIAGIATGQRVIAPNFVTWLGGKFTPEIFGQDLGISRDGWLAETIILPADAIIAVPDNVSDDVAATLAASGSTIWHCINIFGGLQKGDLVLTLGTGGVSILTLQIAKALGADFAITSSSNAKLDVCKDMGADYCVNYRENPGWATALMTETGGRGADIVVDTAGLNSIEQSIAACAPNGRIALIGGLSGQPEKAPQMGGIIGKNLTMKGITAGSRSMLCDVVDLISRENIEPLIDKKFTFGDSPAAFAYLESGDHMGKVMITF